MGETTVTGMEAVVNALKSILTTDVMFINLGLLILVVGGVLIFLFIYCIIKKIVGGVNFGKARI